MTFPVHPVAGAPRGLDLIPFQSWPERDVLVSRDDVPVFRGQILAAPSLDARHVTFTALGVADVLADRYVPAGREILATEATQLAWTLIDDAQQVPGGDLGIQQGLLPDTTARSKKWEQLTPVKSAIDEHAQMAGGFDWAIEPDEAGVYTFNTWAGSRGSDRGVVLEWGRNIQGFSAAVDAGASRIANVTAAVGANQVAVTADDPVSVAAHRMRERVTVSTDQDDATILGDTATGLLERPRWVPRLTLMRDPDRRLDTHLGAINLGDTVWVSIRHGWIELEGSYRIEEIAVSFVGSGDRETEQLEVTVTPA